MTRSLRGPLGWLAMAVLVGLAGGVAQAQAQNAVITGRVNSEQGQPLYGANIYITEMNVSVGTNEAGVYTINIPAARVQGQAVQLRVRSVGFTPQSKPITISAGTQTHNFELKMDVTRLGEVVVTGVTAATEQIKVPFTVTKMDTALMPVAGANPISQLQGKVPGAHIVSATGRPGAAPTMILRGPTSLNAQGRSQSPLFIVDGMPVQGSLPDINPDDIENIEIVKGAAAASIYGSVAGAGVVNITTKTGKNAERVTFGARTEVGGSDIEREFPLAKMSFLGTDMTGKLFCDRAASTSGTNCMRLIDMDEERARINNNAQDYSLAPQLFLQDGGISLAPTYGQLTGLYQATPYPRTYDVVREMTTGQLFNNTSVDVRGRAGEGTAFFGSFGHNRQQGAVRYLQGYTRTSGRLNLDQKFGDKLTMALNSYYAQTSEDGANMDETGSAGGWFTITRTPAFASPLGRDVNGRLYIRHNPLAQGEQNVNPLYGIANIPRVDKGGRFLGGVTSRYTPFEWLSVDGSFSYDRYQGNFQQIADKGRRASTSSPGTHWGYIDEYAWNNEAFNTAIGASARKSLFDDLQATLSGRVIYDQRDTYNQEQYGEDLAVPGLLTGSSAARNFSISSSPQSTRYLAYSGNLVLDFKDRYFFDGSLRKEGNSLFGAGNRWATFGRAGASWVASREPWFPSQNVVSLLKLFSSYGTAGQAPRFSAQYESFTLGTGGTLNPNTLGNSKLKPEINTEIEIGTNMELFNRLALGITYSQAKITDQILPVRPPASSGFSSQWQNAGELQNKTLEITLELPVITRPHLSYSTRVIWDRTTSTITKLKVPPFTGSVVAANTYTIYQFQEGERIGTFYGTDFVRSCSQLPSQFQNQCGGANSAFRQNDMGYIVWVGDGNSMEDGIKRNLWTSNLPAADAPWGTRANWGMPIVLRDEAGAPAFVPLGNSIPDFHLGWSHNMTWKKFTAYALLDAAIGNEVWNIGYHWSLGDFMTAEQDQYGKSVETAKPIGYWWRRGPSPVAGSSGVGGFYDALGPSRFSVEDGSYVKLREMRVSYQLGRVGGVGNWNVGVVGRNLHTWTKFRGWDPESGVTGGTLNSSAINAVAAYRFPNLRSFTLQLGTTF